MRFLGLTSFCLLLATATLHAESKNPSDYPLRVHVFGHNQTTFYHNRLEEESKGDGRANLFENSEARGLDFSFDCPEKLKSSFGFETIQPSGRSRARSWWFCYRYSVDRMPTSPAISRHR